MRKAILAFTILGALSAQAASAQNPAVTSRTGTAQITIPTLLHIDVSNLAVSFGSPTFDDFDAGVIGATSGASVIDTRGNVVHDVTIEADAAAFTGPYTKPASDLQWSTNAGGSWTSLSTTPTDVATAVSRGTNAGVATVDYQLLLDEALDVPGTYSLDFTFTVVAN